MYEEKLLFLERTLGKAKYSHSTKEAEFYCLFCSHHKKKLSINLENNFWKCWVCNKAGKNLLFLLKKGRATKNEMEEYLSKYKIKEEAAPLPTDYDFRINLPPSYVPLLDLKDSVSGQKYYKYVSDKRQISDDKILSFKLGAAPGDREYDGSVIVPSFDREGYVNFFTARSISSSGEYPYRSPKVPKGHKNRIVLNELNINWRKPVVLVEGPFDMMKASANTIPLFGSSLLESSLLFEKIVANDSTVFLALDQDADKKSMEIAKEFSSYNIKVFKIDVRPFKDVGEMTQDEFLERQNSATVFGKREMFIDRLRAL